VNEVPVVVTNGNRSRPEVALTFDADLTTFMSAELDSRRVRSFDNTAVVDELASMHIPATFFLSGLWMLRYPQETRRLVSTPMFEVGSHSYAHVGFAASCYHLGVLPADRMAADVEASERVLRAFTPHSSRLFRFPGGCFDQTALRAVAPTGVQVISYDVASGDAFGTSVRGIIDHTLAAVRPGSIVVFHINGGNTAPLTALALPAIIAGLTSKGLRPVTVEQLLKAAPAS